MKSVPEDLKAKFSEIKLVALDCDGVLTDGKLYYGPNGEEQKVFNVKDGQGIASLLRAGIEVAVITARESLALHHRCRELGIRFLRQSSTNKVEDLKEISEEVGISFDQIVFVGDDLGDVSVLRSSGIGIAVADSSDVAKEAADMITNKDGGTGAVREISDLILKFIQK